MPDTLPTEQVPLFPSICHICFKEGVNLSEEMRLNCKKCDLPYCSAHASKIDIQFCEICVNDLVVVEQVFTKTEDDYNVKTGEFTTRKSSCKQIILSGTSWLFQQNAIAKMSDEQLKQAIQWHKCSVGLMETEILTRKIEASKKLQGVKIARITTGTTTSTPKPRVKKELTQQGMEKIAETLAKLGLTPAKLTELMKNLGQNGQNGGQTV